MRERTPPFAKDVREKLVNNANIKDEPWVEKISYDIRDEAMIDALKAIGSNRAKMDNNEFTIHFKKKKDGTK